MTFMTAQSDTWARLLPKLLLSISALLAMSRPAGSQEVEVQLPGGLSMSFVWVAPGTFTQGLSEDQISMLEAASVSSDGTYPSLAEDLQREQPSREVTISRGVLSWEVRGDP